MKIYLLYGPQGSGKTTQAKLLAEKLGLALISAGEISRELAVKDKRVKELIDRGEPTPEEVIVPAVDEILERNKTGNGFVFDGYPRYAQQVEPLADVLEKHGWEVSKAILISLTQEQGLKRIATRATSERRQDDTPEGIARRLELYHQQTEPIISYFKKLGKLIEIDGSGTIEEVFQSILQALND